MTKRKPLPDPDPPESFSDGLLKQEGYDRGVAEERARWEARLERLRAEPKKPVKSFYDLTRSAGLRDAIAIMEGKNDR